MSLAVVSREDHGVFNSRALPPSNHEMMVYQTMAKQAVSSKMYKGDESAVMMIMLAARELGIPPMQALNGGIHVIQGKVEISARMMSALIRKAGHKIIVKECSNTKCILFGMRSDTGETNESPYTLDDAKQAGLVKPGSGWTKFPKDMCFARAMSRLARQLFSDIIGIGYVEGEISQLNENVQNVTQDKDIEVLFPQEVDPKILVDEFLNEWGEQKEAFREYMNQLIGVMHWDEKTAIEKLKVKPEYTKAQFEIWLEVKQKKIAM